MGAVGSANISSAGGNGGGGEVSWTELPTDGFNTVGSMSPKDTSPSSTFMDLLRNTTGGGFDGRFNSEESDDDDE